MNSACGTVDFGSSLQPLFAHSAPGAKRLMVPRHTHLYSCGDENPAVYLVESGWIKIVDYAHDGKQCLLSIHGPGEMVGELCLLTGRCTETAIAMRSSTVDRVPLRKFRSAFHDSTVSRALLGHLTQRLEEQRRTITDMVVMQSGYRLAAVLLRLAAKLGRGQQGGVYIEQRITQEELAEMVGTTRSRVGYFLKQFCEADLIRRTSGARLFVDTHGLAEYVDSGR